jgi:hypothetical protein
VRCIDLHNAVGPSSRSVRHLINQIYHVAKILKSSKFRVEEQCVDLSRYLHSKCIGRCREAAL